MKTKKINHNFNDSFYKSIVYNLVKITNFKTKKLDSY